jgi:hypothetical protein
MTSATGEFAIASWDEKTYKELDNGGKLTRAEVTMTFTGDLKGSGEAEWLMCYRSDGTARFVGLQRIEVAVDGRDGSFVAESVGDFDGSKAAGTWSVLDGSGTGGLAGIGGGGRFEAPLGSSASFQLDYSIG